MINLPLNFHISALSPAAALSLFQPNNELLPHEHVHMQVCVVEHACVSETPGFVLILSLGEKDLP